MTPPSSGDFGGITFFQARTNSQQISLSGNASGMEGTIYAPAAQLSLSGNGALHMSLIVDRLRLSGNAATALVGESGETDADSTAIMTSGHLDTGVQWVSIPDQGVADPEQLARIRDAIATINQTFGPYGVTLVEVDAASSEVADIRISVGDSSLCGGQADGVLGCTTAWGDITLIEGWNWFAGGDSTSVGAQQYDFQTIITHEIGHSIGVEHSSDTESTMYARLSRGVARREFTAHDLSELAEDGDHHDGEDHDHDSLISALLAYTRIGAGRLGQDD